LITRFLGLGFDGTDYGTAAEIKIEVDGTPGAGDMPGRIIFETTPDGTETMVERMRITNGGLVGIGTGSTTPDGKLHVMTASAGTVTANGNADDLVVEGSGNTGISIITTDTATGDFRWSSPTQDTYFGLVASYNSGSSYGSVRINNTIVGAFYSNRNYFTQQTTIGSTASPDGTLHVLTASAGTVTANANADDLVIEGSASYNGMSILSPDANAGRIMFGSPSSNAHSIIESAYNAGAPTMSVITNISGGSVSLRGGANVFGLSVDGNATAAQTRLLIYDIDNATSSRVSVGAADSGGAGYKVLRIPN